MNCWFMPNNKIILNVNKRCLSFSILNIDDCIILFGWWDENFIKSLRCFTLIGFLFWSSVTYEYHGFSREITQSFGNVKIEKKIFWFNNFHSFTLDLSSHLFCTCSLFRVRFLDLFLMYIIDCWGARFQIC